MKHLIGNERGGLPVYVDLIKSNAAAHIAQQPRLLALIAEVIRVTTIKKSRVSMECDMGRVVGYDFVVSTADPTAVFYAQLLHDTTFTRFVKGGEPTATRHLTLILRRTPDDKAYDLHDAWIGRLRPAQPGSADETATSKSFWAEHATIHAHESLQPRTITKVCPY